MSLGHLSQIALSLCELALKEQSGEQWTGLGCTAFCRCLGAVGRVEHLFLQIYFQPLELGQLPLETRGFFLLGLAAFTLFVAAVSAAMVAINKQDPELPSSRRG